MNVLAGMSTPSPGPTPAARRASSIASVPLATPMQCSTPANSAYSASKAATSSPRMNAVVASTRRHPSSTSSAICSCCHDRSTSGTCMRALHAQSGERMLRRPGCRGRSRARKRGAPVGAPLSFELLLWFRVSFRLGPGVHDRGGSRGQLVGHLLLEVHERRDAYQGDQGREQGVLDETGTVVVS